MKPAPELPLVGLLKEKERVLAAVRKRESLLLLGPPGSGKTRLLKLAAEASAPQGLYIPYVPALHDLLAVLAQGLGLCGERDQLTSVQLRGRLWNALEARPRIIFLDGVERASHRAFRFFQRLYYVSGMAILAAGRNAVDLGALLRLYWDRRHVIELAPLAAHDAGRLFELAADRFGLRELDLDEFRAQVLESAGGNPGQIVEMCRMATKPQYVSGRHVKFAPLRIDAMIRYLG